MVIITLILIPIAIILVELQYILLTDGLITHKTASKILVVAMSCALLSAFLATIGLIMSVQ